MDNDVLFTVAFLGLVFLWLMLDLDGPDDGAAA